jgi:hypothetical protein
MCDLHTHPDGHSEADAQPAKTNKRAEGTPSGERDSYGATAQDKTTRTAKRKAAREKRVLNKVWICLRVCVCVCVCVYIYIYIYM